MHFPTSFIIIATMAAQALAAPVASSSKALMKRSFKVPSKGHRKLSPPEAMAQVYNKYGWDIIIWDPEHPWKGILPSSSAASSFAFSTAPPAYGSSYPGGSSSGPIASSFAPVPSGSSYGPIVSSGVPIPSGSSFGPIASSSFAYPSGSSFAPSASSGGPIQSASSYGSAAPSSGAAPSGSSSSPAQPSASGGTPSSGSEEGEVTATPEENESQYLAPVTIGGQSLTLNLDTGSADLWVYSNGLSSQQTAGHSVFDPSKSSTWSELHGASWEIQYGDGSTASGNVGFDKVDVGGATVQKQCVELAEQISDSFSTQVNSDGIMGLGFSNGNQVSPQPQKTFFDNVMDDLEQPVFTADLEENNSGTYEFGTIDASKYNGEIHYTPVNTVNGYWQFDSPSYSIGGSQRQCTTCSPAIADTGTSLMILDTDIVEEYYSQVQGAQFDSQNGGYIFPCDANLPDFGFAIGDGYTATLSGEELIYAQTNGQCFGGIQPSGASGVEIQILGDVLLKQYFAIFDGGNVRFGLAEKA